MKIVGQVYLAPIPRENGLNSEEVFLASGKYEYVNCGKSDLKPLWEKYQKEFKDLGIDVKKYRPPYEGAPRFEICVNLDDISDLPIDYEKVILLTKEELTEIREREEGNEK